MNREQFLAERKTCIGGSDAADLIDLHPYGCARKLWYDKKGVPEDFPVDENYHMRRGTALEPIAIAEFIRTFPVVSLDNAIHGAGVYRDFVRGGSPSHLTVEHMPWVGVHVDHFIQKFDVADDIAFGPGVLEIKVPSGRAFREIKMSGRCPLSWEVQCQWGMMVSNCTWGAVGVFNPDTFQILKFDVHQDPELQENFLVLARVFWKSLEEQDNPRDRLLAGDKRCDSCPWRRECKGMPRQGGNYFTIQEGIDIAKRKFMLDDSPRLVELLDLWLEAKAEKSECEHYEKDLKEELLEAMGNQSSLLLADGRRLFLHEVVVNMKAKEASSHKRVSIKVLEP